MTTITTYAQDSIAHTYIFSPEVGVGVGKTFQSSAYVLNGQFQVYFENQIVISQILYSQELILGGGDAPSSPLNQIFIVALLYGRTYSFHCGRALAPFFPLSLLVKEEGEYRISGSIGLSFNNSIKRGIATNHSPSNQEPFLTYAEERYQSFGIPIQLEFTKKITSSIGYVHRIYYNYTQQTKTLGVLWGLQYYF